MPFFRYLGFECHRWSWIWFSASWYHLTRTFRSDAFNNGSYDFFIQCLDIGVLFHKFKETIDIGWFFFWIVDYWLQNNPRFLRFILFWFISSRYFRKTPVTDFSFYIVFKKFLNKGIKLIHSGDSLFIFFLAFFDFTLCNFSICFSNEF